MTMQAIPTTSRPRIGEVQVLSSLARASPALPIGIVPIAIPKASLSERSREPGFAMGGKSGTSQVRHISDYERARGGRKARQIPWKERDHALFLAFAPVGAPRYVCATVVEHGGNSGGGGPGRGGPLGPAL